MVYACALCTRSDVSGETVCSQSTRYTLHVYACSKQKKKQTRVKATAAAAARVNTRTLSASIPAAAEEAAAAYDCRGESGRERPRLAKLSKIGLAVECILLNTRWSKSLSAVVGLCT